MLPIHSAKDVVKKDHISWFIFGLMASVTFIGILSELVPSGILPQMTQGLGIEETQVGFLVGIYALASAIFAIPLISMTLAINRKTLSPVAVKPPTSGGGYKATHTVVRSR